MSPSDSQSSVGAGNPGENKDTLKLEQVQAIISKVQAGAGDPLATVMQVTASLPENFVIPGDVLRQAVADSHMALGEPWASIVSGVQDISKSQNKVVVTRPQQLEANVSGTRIRLQEIITFTFIMDNSSPRIADIEGVAAHKFIWLDIEQLELIHDSQQKVLRVVTSGGSRDFVLPQASA